MLSVVIRLALGLVLAFAGWLFVRREARARGGAGWGALALDLAPAATGFLCFLGLGGRPIAAGFLVLALAVGLGFADQVKREVLREPVLFTDMSEFVQLFIHPRLYIPFAGPALVYGGAAGFSAIFLFLLWLEPPVFRPWPVPGLLSLLTLGFLIFGLSREPLLGWAAGCLKRLRPTVDPIHDASRMGLFAMLLCHGVIARSERAARGAAAAQSSIRIASAAIPKAAALPAIVLVQSESFFDARRLGPEIARIILPFWDSLRARARVSGLLEVGGWGANTVRAEFAALSGLPEAAVGFDRFNPYHAFARQYLPALPQMLKNAGYRTICVHPFDRKFYRRDLVLPLLGFDTFIGSEAFAHAATANGWVSDIALGHYIAGLIETAGPPVFIFAITMENHGPWQTEDVFRLGYDPAPSLPQTPEFTELRRYIAGLGSTDAMLRLLHEALVRRGGPALLALYGDHMPSLPKVFETLRFDDSRPDYLIWHSQAAPTATLARARNIIAHELPQALIDCAFGMDLAQPEYARR